MLVTKLPLNLSPKVVYAVIMSAIAWVLAHYAISLPPAVAEAIALAVAAAVGYQAPAGEAIIQDVGVANDVLLSRDAMDHIDR